MRNKRHNQFALLCEQKQDWLHKRTKLSPLTISRVNQTFSHLREWLIRHPNAKYPEIIVGCNDEAQTCTLELRIDGNNIVYHTIGEEASEVGVYLHSYYSDLPSQWIFIDQAYQMIFNNE